MVDFGVCHFDNAGYCDIVNGNARTSFSKFPILGFVTWRSNSSGSMKVLREMCILAARTPIYEQIQSKLESCAGEG